jgi:hypothetical protein
MQPKANSPRARVLVPKLTQKGNADRPLWDCPVSFGSTRFYRHESYPAFGTFTDSDRLRR